MLIETENGLRWLLIDLPLGAYLHERGTGLAVKGPIRNPRTGKLQHHGAKPLSKPEDRERARRAWAGDAGAARELVERHRTFLQGRRRLADRSITRDALGVLNPTAAQVDAVMAPHRATVPGAGGGSLVPLAVVAVALVLGAVVVMR
jgi:hypothetical protein